MPGCVVPDCQHYELAHSIGVPFHRFPKDAATRKQWLLKIRNKNLPANSTFEAVKELRVCGKHFVPSDYERDLQHELMGSKPKNILKKGAVPSIFKFAQKAAKPERSAVVKRKELQQQQARVSFAFGSAQQQEEAELVAEPQPSTSYEIISPDIDFSSPTKESGSEVFFSSPFKPGSSEEETTDITTTTESEGETSGDESKFIVTKNKLMELVKRCQKFGEGIVTQKSWTVGAKLNITWECVKGHEGQWESCNNIRGMPAINLMLASAIVLSGSTFQSTKNLAELLNLRMIGKTSFNAVQNSYILPVIDQVYTRQYHQNMALLISKTLGGEDVSILGDARSDSPGFSAKYTTYTMMEEKTNKIVEMQLLQVTETGSSVAMEKAGFQRCLENILHHGVDIKTITTGRSPSIRKLMREDYKSITHQFDCWHVCKGVKKKCLANGRKKGHELLIKWVKSITNHLWYSCSACNGDAAELKRIWQSILYHLTGVHHWEEEDGTKHACQHPPLSAEEQEARMWFNPHSTVYRVLRSIVMDKKLNSDLEQLCLFKHTSNLEVYHSAMLKFAPKRLHFHHTAMKGRMQLAVLDHNHNTGRQPATTQSGKVVYRFVSSKQKGGEWTAKKVFQAKSHEYASDMMMEIAERRKDPSVLYTEKESVVARKDLPKNIAKERRPTVEQLIAKKFKK